MSGKVTANGGARTFYHFAVAPFYHDTLRRLVDLDSNPAWSENVNRHGGFAWYQRVRTAAMIADANVRALA
jgi:hypothetical protein